MPETVETCCWRVRVQPTSGRKNAYKKASVIEGYGDCEDGFVFVTCSDIADVPKIVGAELHLMAIEYIGIGLYRLPKDTPEE